MDHHKYDSIRLMALLLLFVSFDYPSFDSLSNFNLQRELGYNTRSTKLGQFNSLVCSLRFTKGVGQNTRSIKMSKWLSFYIHTVHLTAFIVPASQS